MATDADAAGGRIYCEREAWPRFNINGFFLPARHCTRQLISTTAMAAFSFQRSKFYREQNNATAYDFFHLPFHPSSGHISERGDFRQMKQGAITGLGHHLTTAILSFE